MNPKKALKKGLSGITEQDFINTMVSFAKERDSQEGSMGDDNLFKEKYPFYKQLMKMSVTAAKDGNAIQIAHFSGMAVAYRILLQIAEEKV
ncbi:MAG: hypothetical protein K9L82_14385 [Chromatiaceae bacterium]|nr:hypothetical protein [Chromatiaceae bacterium]MCF7995601.1 hypothetical protein [Chromatiaceae bacterium]